MWEKIVIVVLLGVLAFVLLGMGFGGRDDGTGAYKKLSSAEAKAVMDSEEPYVLLDVRTEEEFQERHIRGAMLIPHTEMKNRAAAEIADKDALIIVYCRSGRRSAIAGKNLARLGYTRVYDLGGINDWPYETVTGAGNARP